MSKKAAKPSKKPVPTKASERSSERGSQNKTTSPTHQVKGTSGPEHDLGSSPKVEAEASNGETELPADSERPITDHSRSEAGPAGRQNHEFVRNSGSFVRSETRTPPEFDDGKPEGNSAFASKSQQLMEKLYSQGMSIGEVAKLWGMSKSGVWSRVQHVTPKLATPSVQEETPPPSSLSQPINNDNSDGSYPSQIPRISSEITGDRPRVIEQNNGSLSTGQTGFGQSYPSPVEDEVGSRARPIRVVIEPNSPALQGVLVELLSIASSRNVGFEQYLEKHAVEDLRDTEFSKAVLALDGEEYRDALLLTVKKANAYDKTRRETLLETGEN